MIEMVKQVAERNPAGVKTGHKIDFVVRVSEGQVQLFEKLGLRRKDAKAEKPAKDAKAGV